MAIAMSKTREQFPLSTKKIIKKTFAGIFVLFIIFFTAYIFGAIVMLTSNNSGLFLLMTIGLLLFMGIFSLLVYLYQKWYYDVYFYDLTSDYVVIKKGPITPKEITIPYERIQDIYVDQDLFDRIFGLYDVHLSSATISSGMEAHIDGVEKPAADGLRAMLLQTVSERISKNKASVPPQVQQ